MAEAFCRELGKGVRCESVGTRPAEEVMPDTVKVMEEVDIDVSKARPRGFADLSRPGYDILVTMGRDVVPPFLPCDKLVKWRIPDPYGRGIKDYRRVRDRVRKQVFALLESLDRLKGDPARNA
jgi:arsenate reductase